MVHKGEYPGKSTVSFLRMIDMSPTDMSCIYSTLTFVSNLANRYDIPPVLTFDKLLYWKALNIVQNEQANSQLKSFVLQLGGFHTQMSFLGSIGHIMSNSGIQEILELIYAPNAGSDILNGKLKHIPGQEEDDLNQANDNRSEILHKAADLHTELLEGDISTSEACNWTILETIESTMDRDPFKGDDSLRNIESGITADSSVNADSAEEDGKGIIQSLVGKNIMDCTFRKKQQLITLSNKTSVKIDGELVEVDPQLLFQRCTTIANTLFDDISVIFQFELCSVPSALFDSNRLPREAHKSVSSDSICNLVKSEATEINTEHVKYVLDGGSLIHRIPWVKGQTFSNICESYVQYAMTHYSDATIVFDGYPDTPTLKDVTYIRRTKGILTPKLEFTPDMSCRSKKEVFLSNSYNKQRFIEMLSLKLQDCNYKVVIAPDDADVTIVQTALQHVQNTCSQVIVIGEDTDLLVILCSRSQSGHHNIYFKSEPKQNNLRIRIWDINKTKEKLGKTIHAFTGY
ncbi:unnamed protein product [Mytilus coruscus]|uniref:Uncharacterized protein n=1 Tax=Mytilus coruscus TaxID=42192 RepID=A0A6J8EW98_MYTCO|nr:unnamed protein product [Mytilus coruscus]